MISYFITRGFAVTPRLGPVRALNTGKLLRRYDPMVRRNRNAQPFHRLTFGGTGNSVTPGAASLTLTGYTPTVSRTANQALTPGVQTLTITGFAPTLTQSGGQSLTPGAASFTITGYAPTVQQAGSVSLSPGAASLAVTGYAPTVYQSGTPLETLIVGVLRTVCPRAYPEFAPFNTPRPYVIYQFVGGPSVDYLDKTSNIEWPTVQIDVWSDGRGTTNQLMRAITDAMRTATTFNASPRGFFRTDADSESERYGASQDFAVFKST